jgi:hypothetical protein
LTLNKLQYDFRDIWNIRCEKVIAKERSKNISSALKKRKPKRVVINPDNLTFSLINEIDRNKNNIETQCDNYLT